MQRRIVTGGGHCRQHMRRRRAVETMGLCGGGGGGGGGGGVWVGVWGVEMEEGREQEERRRGWVERGERSGGAEAEEEGGRRWEVGAGAEGRAVGRMREGERKGGCVQKAPTTFLDKQSPSQEVLAVPEVLDGVRYPLLQLGIKPDSLIGRMEERT